MEKKTVITVLTEGKKLANELKRQLRPTTTSRETCDVLVESILSSYENAITLLALFGDEGSSQISGKLFDSVEDSPRSEGSDQLQNCRKRKSLPRWSEQVRVSEGQSDDGYNWRKYGQKDILGAVHPRAYYRCTHRNTQGCLATKQVQRADEDSTVFEVIYRGKHSCRQERLKQINKERKVEESRVLEEQTPSFSFPSTPIEYEIPEPHFFSESANNFITTSYSPSFLSPATSESYLMNGFGIGHSLQSSDSEFGEIISNPTTGIMDFPLDLSMDFECPLLDASDYF